MSKQSRIREKDPGVFHDSNESLCLCECEVRIMICAPGLLGYVRSKLFVCMKYDVDFLGKEECTRKPVKGASLRRMRNQHRMPTHTKDHQTKIISAQVYC